MDGLSALIKAQQRWFSPRRAGLASSLVVAVGSALRLPNAVTSTDHPQLLSAMNQLFRRRSVYKSELFHRSFVACKV